MKRKFGKKNIKMFILFSFFVILLICLFIYIVIKALSYEEKKYTINPDSFMYDISNNYVLVKNKAELSKKWDKNYYLKENDKKVKLGTDVVVFNGSDSLIYLYGNNFKVDLNGNITYNTNKIDIPKLGSPTFYKLDDRKY